MVDHCLRFTGEHREGLGWRGAVNIAENGDTAACAVFGVQVDNIGQSQRRPGCCGSTRAAAGVSAHHIVPLRPSRGAPGAML